MPVRHIVAASHGGEIRSRNGAQLEKEYLSDAVKVDRRVIRGAYINLPTLNA